MIKEIYKYQFPVFKIEAAITVFTIFVALVLANAIWETTMQKGDKLCSVTYFPPPHSMKVHEKCTSES